MRHWYCCTSPLNNDQINIIRILLAKLMSLLVLVYDYTYVSIYESTCLFINNTPTPIIVSPLNFMENSLVAQYISSD